MTETAVYAAGGVLWRIVDEETFLAAGLPGYDTYKEMRTMAQIGIPLQAIFAAATINNARSLRLDKDYGTIERGKVANLVLLDANPLASIDAWTKIDQVILRGEPIERESLAAGR